MPELPLAPRQLRLPSQKPADELRNPLGLVPAPEGQAQNAPRAACALEFPSTSTAGLDRVAGTPARCRETGPEWSPANRDWLAKLVRRHSRSESGQRGA